MAQPSPKFYTVFGVINTGILDNAVNDAIAKCSITDSKKPTERDIRWYWYGQMSNFFLLRVFWSHSVIFTLIVSV